jgi:TolA-binding protein
MMRMAFPAMLLTAVLAAPAAAQTTASVTQSDIQRLQDSVYQAGSDVSQLRSRDATRASQLQAELDELREEVIYLKVKLRKENTLARTEYSDVRDRIEDLRTRARGDATGAYSTPSSSTTSGSTTGSTYGTAGATTRQPSTAGTTAGRSTTGTTTNTSSQSANTVEVPAGTEIDLRLSNPLNSGTTQVEDRFEATTMVDFMAGGRTVIPAGSVMRGVVTAVEPATRTNRTAKMTISFDQLTINGRAYPVRATVTQAIQGEGIKGEVGRAGAGAAVGGVLGAVLGGVKGAVLGAIIGGGGTIAATEGKEIELPQGTVLRVRFDSPLQVSR